MHLQKYHIFNCANLDINILNDQIIRFLKTKTILFNMLSHSKTSFQKICLKEDRYELDTSINLSFLGLIDRTCSQ
jgi:hypothetical protein